MGTGYASGTQVTVEKSMAEAQAILHRYGITDVGLQRTTKGGRIQFKTEDRAVQFTVTAPALTDEAVAQWRNGQTRPMRDRPGVQAQLERERWRALVLVLKAKLESVRSGVETAEQAFLAQILLPEGITVGERLQPVLEQAYTAGVTPSLLQLTD